MKLHSISFKNFRIFENQRFEFKPLTVLTGPNSSGKSTLVKGLTLLQENIKPPNYLGRLTFKVGNHQLGSFESIRTRNSKTKSIIFELKYEFPDLTRQTRKSRNTQTIWEDVKFIIVKGPRNLIFLQPAFPIGNLNIVIPTRHTHTHKLRTLTDTSEAP